MVRLPPTYALLHNLECHTNSDQPITDLSDVMMFPSMSECTTAIDDDVQLRFRNLFPIVVHPSGYRKYGWGVCDINDPMHSDFALLRELLFDRANLQRLITATSNRTTRYIEEKLQMEKTGETASVSEETS